MIIKSGENELRFVGSKCSYDDHVKIYIWGFTHDMNINNVSIKHLISDLVIMFHNRFKI